PSPETPHKNGWCVRLLHSSASDGQWEQYPAQCVWRAPKNTDLALLRILNGNPVPEHEVVFAALSCDTRDLEAVGYPLAKRDEQDNAREYRVSGHLQIESSASSFAFTVQMADTP